jgi:hypothetical protein
MQTVQDHTLEHVPVLRDNPFIAGTPGNQSQG